MQHDVAMRADSDDLGRLSRIAASGLPRLALCFSGNPRNILDVRTEWDRCLELLRSKYEVLVYFHAWAATGKVIRNDQGWVEGRYRPERFDRFDELIRWLDPVAYVIESYSEALQDRVRNFPSVYVWQGQAKKPAILSQLYSIERANELRVAFERAHPRVSANIVYKLRFDLLPRNIAMSDYEFLLNNPDLPIGFVQSPFYHAHPGGGGGCLECESFFQRCRYESDAVRMCLGFLSSHSVHSNDICDLVCIAGPAVMNAYAGMFSKASLLWKEIEKLNALRVNEVGLIPEVATENPDWLINECNMDGGEMLERVIHCFYPEKLIRFGTPGMLMLHGGSSFSIHR